MLVGSKYIVDARLTVHLTYPGLGLLTRAPSLVLCPHFIDEDTKAQKVGLVDTAGVKGQNWDLTPGLYDFQAFVFKCCSSGEQLVNLGKLPVETWDIYSH